MDRNRPMEAVKAFDVAIAKTTPKSKTASEAAYGKSLAYLRVGLTDQAAVAAAEAPQTETRKIDLAVQLLTQRALAAYARAAISRRSSPSTSAARSRPKPAT